MTLPFFVDDGCYHTNSVMAREFRDGRRQDVADLGTVFGSDVP
jgi:hypothetical protein